MPAKEKIVKRGKNILWEKVPYNRYVRLKHGTLMYTVLKTADNGGYICNDCASIGEFIAVEDGSLCYQYYLVPA